ncbi:MAG: rhodanese-like domain-containing protein, partial [Pseudomonadota bacterium]
MDRYIEFVTNHWILFIALIVVITLLVQDLLENAFQKTKLLSPTQAVAEMNNDETVVIDVREPQEYSKGHIANSIN